MRTALILDLLFDANDWMGAPVPLTEFHNRAISEAANLKEEYLVSGQDRVPAGYGMHGNDHLHGNESL